MTDQFFSFVIKLRYRTERTGVDGRTLPVRYGILDGQLLNVLGTQSVKGSVLVHMYLGKQDQRGPQTPKIRKSNYFYT